MNKKNQRTLVGFRPTNRLHLGNYFGSINTIKNLNPEQEVFVFSADLHSLTDHSNQSSSQNSSHSIQLIKTILSCVSRPCVFYVQSDFPQTTFLSWVFSCFISTGALIRMTQVKHKSTQLKKTETTSAGLYFYPVLMCADILGSQSHVVAVGEDQVQHVELARDLALKLKPHMDFPMPEALLSPAKRIKSLFKPDKKMSKSQESDGVIFLDSSNDEIHRLIKAAVTDSLNMPDFYENNFSLNSIEKERPGVFNLCSLFNEIAGNEKLKDFSNKKLSLFKESLTDVLIDFITPIRENMKKISDQDVLSVIEKNKHYVDNIFNESVAMVKKSLLM